MATYSRKLRDELHAQLVGIQVGKNLLEDERTQGPETQGRGGCAVGLKYLGIKGRGNLPGDSLFVNRLGKAGKFLLDQWQQELALLGKGREQLPQEVGARVRFLLHPAGQGNGVDTQQIDQTLFFLRITQNYAKQFSPCFCYLHCFPLPLITRYISLADRVTPDELYQPNRAKARTAPHL